MGNELNNSFIIETIRKMSGDIARKKEAIILKRLKSLGIDIDMKIEDKRRFSRLSLESNGVGQTLYYNDGSVDGLRVVTFVQTQKPFNPNDKNPTFGYEETYY
tara:strand:- start:111 stop:419 length:309 start_codon:yes stop_codon:yes gene_type:complete